MKPVPVTLINVPPTAGPDAGLTPVTAGDAEVNVPSTCRDSQCHHHSLSPTATKIPFWYAIARQSLLAVGLVRFVQVTHLGLSRRRVPAATKSLFPYPTVRHAGTGG